MELIELKVNKKTYIKKNRFKKKYFYEKNYINYNCGAICFM